MFPEKSSPSNSPPSFPLGMEMAIKMTKTRTQVVGRLLSQAVRDKKITEAQQKAIEEKFLNLKTSFAKSPKQALDRMVRASTFAMAGINEASFYATLLTSLETPTDTQSLQKDIKKLLSQHHFSESNAKKFVQALGSDSPTAGEDIAQFLSHVGSDLAEVIVTCAFSYAEPSTLLENLSIGLEHGEEKGLITAKQKEELQKSLINFQSRRKTERAVADFCAEAVAQASQQMSPTELKTLLKRVPEFRMNTPDPKSQEASETFSSEGLAKRFSYEHSEQIPQRICDFSVPEKEDHTMDTKKYLKNRIAGETLDKVKQHPDKVEFFLGNLDEMKAFYAIQEPPMVYAGRLQSPTSTQFHLFENPNDPGVFKIVLGGIGSATRINHQCLQFKFAGVDISKIRVRGNFADMYNEEFSFLREKLDQYRGKPMVCVMGQRWFPMEFLAKSIYPDLKNAPEGTAYDRLQPESCSYGSLSFDITAVETEEQDEVVVVALRMPNGSLAGEVTSTLLEAGVTSFIMTGAGGALSNESGVGAYQMLAGASYAGEEVTLPPQALAVPDMSGTQMEEQLSLGGKNITVDSPLEEDKAWLSDAREKASSVDVESFHILNALSKKIEEDEKPRVRVVAGLFNSDIVGEHPLEGKIDIDNAYQHLEVFLEKSYETLGIRMKQIEEKK